MPTPGYVQHRAIDSESNLLRLAEHLHLGPRMPRIPTIETSELAHVTGGGGINFGQIMQMASPLLSMIPGVGGFMGMLGPMLGGLGGGQKQQQQQAQQPQAQPQPQAAPEPQASE